MKINKLYSQYLDTNKYKVNEDKQKQMEIKKEKDVSVQISSSAKELVQKINQSNDGKLSEKVEKIRKSVQAGTYKVSSDEIAERILKAIEEEKGSDQL